MPVTRNSRGASTHARGRKGRPRGRADGIQTGQVPEGTAVRPDEIEACFDRLEWSIESLAEIVAQRQRLGLGIGEIRRDRQQLIPRCRHRP